MSETTWQEGLSLGKKHKSLSQDLEVDVLIIGGGLCGITTAYLLSKTKLNVALIEKGIIGDDNAATSLTTAFITCVIDTDLSTVADVFGPTQAKSVWQAQLEAVDLIEENVKQEKIDCEFKRVSDHIYATKESHVKGLEEEAEFAKSLGFDVEFKKSKLGFQNYGYMEVKNQAKFHPLKYTTSLLSKAQKNGVKVFENTEALEVIEKDNKVLVSTKGHAISASNVVMATYSPFTHPLEMYFKAGLYITYILEAQIPKGIIREGIYEDSESPYHYFRIDSGKKFDRMILGGEDHREDIPVSSKRSFQALKKYLKELLSGYKYKIVKTWTGPILEPIDGLSYIGRYKKNSRQLVTHGFSGNGMTYATVAAKIFSDDLTGRKNEYAKIFDAARFPPLKSKIAKGIDYSKTLLGGAIKNTINPNI